MKTVFMGVLSHQGRLGCEGSAVQICPSRPNFPLFMGFFTPLLGVVPLPISPVVP